MEITAQGLQVYSDATMLAKHPSMTSTSPDSNIRTILKLNGGGYVLQRNLNVKR